METQNIRNILKKAYVATALYAAFDIAIRLEHGQGFTEYIFNALEYMSLIYQSSADSAMAITDLMENDLSSKVESLYDKINVKTVFRWVENAYASVAYIHGTCFVMKNVK